MQLSVNTTLSWTLLMSVQTLHLHVTCLLWLMQKSVRLNTAPKSGSTMQNNTSRHFINNMALLPHTFSSASSIINILSSLYIIHTYHIDITLSTTLNHALLIVCNTRHSFKISHVGQFEYCSFDCISRATLRIVGIKAKVHSMHVRILVQIISPESRYSML